MLNSLSVFLLMVILGARPAVAGDDTLTAASVIEKAREAARQNRLKTYKLKTYTKSFLNRYDKKRNAFVTEATTFVHSDVYWKKPNQRREIETAYRHVHVPKFFEYDDFDFGMIDDFSRSNIPVSNTSVVGPLSPEAERYYRFELLDTVTVKGFSCYRVRISPKTEYKPLMDGTLAITADTYRLIQADVTFNSGVKLFPQPKTFTLRQTFALQNGTHWIPDECDWRLRFDGSLMGYEINAEWYSVSKTYACEINPVIDDRIFSGRLIEQTADARYKDSTFWNENQIISMTAEEEEGFRTLASLQENTKILYPDMQSFDLKQKKENVRWGFKALPDFRYNRVEGTFLGGEIQLNNIALKRYLRDLSLKGKFGYGFMDKQYKYVTEVRKAFLSRTFAMGARYYDDIAYREIAGNVLTNSLTALTYRYDAFSYYYIKGYETFVQIKPRYNLKIEFNYTDRTDDSTSRNAKYALVDWLYKNFDPVYPINIGRMRRISASVSYMLGHGTGITSREVYWILEGNVEHSSRGFLKSDFNFTKYYGTARFHYPTTRRGSLDGKIYGGYGTHELPQQYLFDLYGGSSPYALKTVGLREAEGNHFQGNYMAEIALEHNFGGEWLERTGLPFLRDGNIDLIPTFAVGYAEFSKGTFRHLPDKDVLDLHRPIFEAGFAIGDIHRFARLDLSWRLNQRQKGTMNFNILFSIMLQNY